MKVAASAMLFFAIPLMAFGQNRVPSGADYEIPTNGSGGSEAFARLDMVMKGIMRKEEFPGSALVILDPEGKVVYSRGFGYANLEERTPFTPGTMSRLASVSKLVTMSGILTLVQHGSLSPNTRVAEYLYRHGTTFYRPQDQEFDARVGQITLQNLWEHKSGLPAGTANKYTQEMYAKVPGLVPSPDNLAGAVLGICHLDSAPGERFQYSNLGYAVLGTVIEKASGESQEAYFKEGVLSQMRLDASQWNLREVTETRAPGEAVAYDVQGDLWVTCDDRSIEERIRYGSNGWYTSADQLAMFAKRFSDRYAKGTWTAFGENAGASAMSKRTKSKYVLAFLANGRRGSSAKRVEVALDRALTLILLQ